MIIQQIFQEYQETKHKTEISISQMKNDLGDLIDKIVLYGAGSAGIAFLSYLHDIGIYPKCFADGSPGKWGTVCENLPVIDYLVFFLGKEFIFKVLLILTFRWDLNAVIQHTKPYQFLKYFL